MNKKRTAAKKTSNIEAAAAIAAKITREKCNKNSGRITIITYKLRISGNISYIHMNVFAKSRKKTRGSQFYAVEILHIEISVCFVDIAVSFNPKSDLHSVSDLWCVCVCVCGIHTYTNTCTYTYCRTII